MLLFYWKHYDIKYYIKIDYKTIFGTYDLNMALDFTLALEIHNGYPQWMKDMKELVVDMLGCKPSNQ